MSFMREPNAEPLPGYRLIEPLGQGGFGECRDAGRSGIPRETLLRNLRDAAEALDHMNEKHGLQHLDVKPRNLFLVSDRVKVADFGLVKHLEMHSVSGVQGAVTPLYGA